MAIFMLKIRSKVWQIRDLAFQLLLTSHFYHAFTKQARSTTNGEMRREIQNPLMFETDPKSFSPAIYFSSSEIPTSFLTL
jgi:hypothetical protein